MKQEALETDGTGTEQAVELQKGSFVINGSSASGYEVACMVGMELTLQMDFFFFLKQLIYFLFYVH